MIPKSGYRFSEKIMLQQSMIPKSGYRFSEKIMLQQSRRTGLA
jgi:DNA-binding winged helix-turn-helix (wHTH) protein